MPTRTAVLLLALAPLSGAGVVSWSFDKTTTGEDILWTSPTAVEPTASVFATTTTITLVEVGIEFEGIPFGTVDVTDQIPPEVQGQTENAPGPAPIELLDEPVVVPEPPEPPAVQADVSLGIDAAGFGMFAAENVVLGTLEVDLGFPFGVVDVDITSLRVAGTVVIEESGSWIDVGLGLAGSGGVPTLAASGTMLGGDDVTYALADMLADSTTTLVVGFTRIDAPFKGGTLVPNPDVLVSLPTGPLGEVSLTATWPLGVPSGVALHYQSWTVDGGAPQGLAGSNGLTGTTP